MQTLVKEIRSPLRYPGGKTRAAELLLSKFPDFREYREPFVGGGSVALKSIQRWSDREFWINDLNFDLFCFWLECRTSAKDLASYVEYDRQKAMASVDGGKALFEELKNSPARNSTWARAARFFILNRITFSGTIESGGYSQEAYEKRFTLSSVARITALSGLLTKTKITNLDYEEVMEVPGEDVFIFLDPPYWGNKSSKLYGINGDLHSGFDHDRFAEVCRRSTHKLAITLDNCPEVLEAFDGFNIEPFDLQYGMNNYRQASAAIGKEVLITNY